MMSFGLFLIALLTFITVKK
ncbi:putative holin-like toxin [Phascolarctobacterium sp.]